MSDESQVGRPDPLPESLRLSAGYLLARLGAESRGLWARMLSEHQLTPHHFGVLMALAQLGEAHQQRLADAIGVDPRNAVAILESLSQRGLLDQRRDPGNRRRKIIRLTPHGAQLITELHAAGASIENELFAGMTTKDRRSLHALLIKLAERRSSQ